MRKRKSIVLGAKIGAVFGFVSPFALVAVQEYLLPVLGWIVFLDGNFIGLFFLFSPLPGLTGFLLATAANTTLYAGLGALGVFFVRKIRLFSLSQCQKCGYDLTGNVSGVCSECGTEIETK